MKKIITILILIAGIFILSGCSHYASPINTPEANMNNIPSQNPTATEGIAVQIKNFTFIPKNLTVKKGTTVTWTNDDNAPHQIKSAIFDSGLISKSQVFSFTFNEVGVFDYSCPIHPSMLGKIIVE